jgi:hypothetical protein
MGLPTDTAAAMAPEEEKSRFQEGTSLFIEEHLKTVRKKIEDTADKLMKDRGISEQMAAAKAIELFAPGDEFHSDPEPRPVGAEFQSLSRGSRSFPHYWLLSSEF